MVHPFDKLPGVREVISGYTGGHTINPTYEENSSGTTGHAEAIQVTYDPAKISYADLLEVFWRQINPTDAGGQFVDRGNQYRSAIFYHNDEQKRLAEESRDRLAKSGRFTKPIVTEIVKASTFYKAEEYHQYYYKKNPIRYKYYRFNSGRDKFLDKVWERQGLCAREDPNRCVHQAECGGLEKEAHANAVQGNPERGNGTGL